MEQKYNEIYTGQHINVDNLVNGVRTEPVSIA